MAYLLTPSGSAVPIVASQSHILPEITWLQSGFLDLLEVWWSQATLEVHNLIELKVCAKQQHLASGNVF